MKVSRKVARRSHRSRYSSVSRRRLRNKKSRSGYRKKNAKTQRGGARSRKYGHKRGKRFHRGGENTDFTLDTEYARPIISFISNSKENPSRIYRLANDLQLRYNKLFYPFTTSTFILTFYILLGLDVSYTEQPLYQPKVCMTLTRFITTGRDSLIFVKFGTLTDVLKYLKQFYLSESITESGYMFNSSGSLEKKKTNDEEKNQKK